jgi:hypothetical protein
MVATFKSLYGKILATNAFSVFLLALLTLAITGVNDARDAQQVLAAKSHNLLNIMSKMSVPYYEKGEYKVFETIAREILLDHDITRVKFFDAGGAQLFTIFNEDREKEDGLEQHAAAAQAF